MAAPDLDVIRWGRERARTTRWRGSTRTALLTPLPGTPVPTPAFVSRCLETLRARGFTGVITGALAPPEQRAFLAAGFAEAERLHLLAHDLWHLPEVAVPGGVTLHRTSLRDSDAVRHILAVDHAAFPPFWHLDESGLREAMSATPRSRLIVAVTTTGAPPNVGVPSSGRHAATTGHSEVGGRVVGYAVTGRSGRNGYLQRLAVHPEAQGLGLGAALVVDGLRWLRRWRTDRCVVNTQQGNAAALALYERLGFRRLPHGLAVLAAGDVDQ